MDWPAAWRCCLSLRWRSSASTPDVFGLIVLLIAVVLAFLIFNFPLRVVQPVRTFMGDAGSTFLGLAIASIGVWLSQGVEPRVSPVVGFVVCGSSRFRLFSTIIRRAAEGKSPFAPDGARTLASRSRGQRIVATSYVVVDADSRGDPVS